MNITMSVFKRVSVAALTVASLTFASLGSAETLTTADARYLGLITDGIPSSPTNEVLYINTLLAQPLNSGPTTVGTEDYTRSGNLCLGMPCDPAVLLGSDKVEGDDLSNMIDVGDGYEYLLGKYDAGQAGSYVWYIGGLTGIIEIPSALGTCGNNGCGLSHISLYNPGGGTDDDETVPEPASLALVGLGLLAAAGARRRRQRT